MDLDIAFYKGEREKPAVLFIHGLGMNKNVWENPSESYVLGGSLPLALLLSRKPSKKDYGDKKRRHVISFPRLTAGIRPVHLTTSFGDMKSKGYSVVTWSQRRPVGPIQIAVTELKEIIDVTSRWNKNGIILVGHSRGGLIARKYLVREDKRVKGLITICSPHRGSSIARLALYSAPLATAISPLFSRRDDRGKVKIVVKRILDFLKSTAVQELLPDSDLIVLLNNQETKGIPCMTIGGTRPSIFTLYRWKKKSVMKDSDKKYLLIPQTVLLFPDIFEKIIPDNLYPEEFKKGKGDGLVTAKSSRISWCSNHHDFRLNHVEVLCDRNVRKKIADEIVSISRS